MRYVSRRYVLVASQACDTVYRIPQEVSIHSAVLHHFSQTATLLDLGYALLNYYYFILNNGKYSSEHWHLLLVLLLLNDSSYHAADADS